MAYACGVKVISMMPPALMRAFRAAALMSRVFLKWGMRAWCMGCRALSCLCEAMSMGSMVACERNLQIRAIHRQCGMVRMGFMHDVM